MISPSDDPEVTHYGALDMQVRVPSNWTDDEVVDFANRENPSGTANGWGIRKEGDKALGGERTSGLSVQRGKALFT